MVEGLDHAAKAMMANAFSDLGRIPDDERETRAFAASSITLILLDGDLHQGLEHI